MQTIATIATGVSCDARLTADGWCAGIVAVPDADAECLAELGRHTVELKPGKTETDWSRAVVEARSTLEMATQRDGRLERRTVAESALLCGVAAAVGGQPGLVWCERSDGVSYLKLARDGEVSELRRGAPFLRNPVAACVGAEGLVACELRKGGRDVTQVLDGSGAELFETHGRNPRLAVGADGVIWLLVERRLGPERVSLAVCELRNGALRRELLAPDCHDLNFNADLAVDPGRGELLMVCESCPAWGVNELTGQFRDVVLWRLEPGAHEFAPGPGTGNGIVPLQRRAFFDTACAFNSTPVKPQIVFMQGRIGLSFKQFRFVGRKGFGWDAMLTSCADGRWRTPVRLTQDVGAIDAGYALLPDAGQLLGFFPLCDHTCRVTFAEEEAGQPERGCRPVENYRVEIVAIKPDDWLPPTPWPDRLERAYVIPPSVRAAAPAPPELDAPAPLQLVWGDIHAHTVYSKCMSANDGAPQDVLRLQRDVFGCRVLCLTDHVEYMSDTEFRHVLDCVEREAGDDCVPLFGVEWAKHPAHHTNFYAIDRAVFDRLRALMLACDHLTPLYERIKTELPAGSVTALRHFHGMTQDEFGCAGERCTELHDPAVEWAMETMQTRGNMMMPGSRDPRQFPANFLNAGAQIGFVGGSDHSRGFGPNRFCLTGFWVGAPTPEQVFDALRDRRTVATANGKIALWAELDGARLGQSTAARAPVRVQVQASSATPIRRICLLRDGQCLEWRDTQERRLTLDLVDAAPGPGRHWYAVTAEAESAYGDPPVLAHASPFFVEV